MTNKTIQGYGGSVEARKAFEKITRSDLVVAGRTLGVKGRLAQTYNAMLRSMDSGHASLQDLAAWSDDEIVNGPVRRIGRKGIPLLNQLLEASKNAMIRRSRDEWSLQHHGLTHPDDKIQPV